MKIAPTGHISYTVKLSTVTVCPMLLFSFPMDRQMCTLAMYSFSNYMHEIKLNWTRAPTLFYAEAMKPLPQFELEHFVQDVKVDFSIIF